VGDISYFILDILLIPRQIFKTIPMKKNILKIALFVLFLTLIVIGTVSAWMYLHVIAAIVITAIALAVMIWAVAVILLVTLIKAILG